MSIQDEQAKAVTEAISRMKRSDADALRHIARMTRDSSCALCEIVHALATAAGGTE